jgi:hypothetical protein
MYPTIYTVPLLRSVSIWDPTMRFCKKSMSSWICFLWGPEDDPVKVETCRPDSILYIYTITSKYYLMYMK